MCVRQITILFLLCAMSPFASSRLIGQMSTSSDAGRAAALSEKSDTLSHLQLENTAITKKQISDFTMVPAKQAVLNAALDEQIATYKHKNFVTASDLQLERLKNAGVNQHNILSLQSSINALSAISSDQDRARVFNDAFDNPISDLQLERLKNAGVNQHNILSLQSSINALSAISSDQDRARVFNDVFDNAKAHRVSSRVTFTTVSPGAIVSYQDYGSRTINGPSITLGGRTSTTATLTIGMYYFWADRGGQPTSDKNRLVVITAPEETVNLDEQTH